MKKLTQDTILFEYVSEKESQKMTTQLTGSPLLVKILNLGSIFGFVPFKICIDPKSQLYYIAPIYFIRKIICASIQVISIVFMCRHVAYIVINEVFQVAGPMGLPKILNALTAIGSLGISLAIQPILWTTNGHIHLLTVIESTRIQLPDQTNFVAARWMDIFAAAVFIFNYLTCNYTYRFYDPENIQEDALSLTPMGLLLHFTIYHPMSFLFFSYALISMLGLAALLAANQFSMKMELYNLTNIDEGIHYYKAIKKMSVHMSRLFGNQIIFYYVIAVSFLARIPDPNVWSSRPQVVTVIAFLCFGPWFWLSAAGFHLKVRETMVEWWRQLQHRKDLSKDLRIRIMDFRNDYMMDPAGISCKFFTITYHFIGSMLGLILTYAIIVFQMLATE